MTTEKMTVHRVLAELKTMDSRIENAIEASPYVLAVKRSAEKINGMTVAELKQKLQSDYQKVSDLMRRRDAMKRALVLSNATTKVEIGGVEYTVAEAIDAKNHAVEMKRNLVNRMAACYQKAQYDINRYSGEAIEKAAEQYVLSTINAQPKDAKMSIDSEAMQAVRKAYIENNTWDLIDPLNVVKIMEELRNEINKFTADVDAALSTSNALTIVEFSY